MADVNGVVNGHSSIADDAYLTIQAASGEEWMIVNINAPEGSEIELYKTDGTNDIKIGTDDEGGWSAFKFFITNSIYLKVKNTSGSTIYISYDGVRTA